MKHRVVFLLQLLLVVAVFGLSGGGLAEGAKTFPQPTLSQAGVESRLKNLTRLADTSSGARRIQGSSNRTAMAKHAEAKELLERAGLLKQAGDLEQTDALLAQVTKLMFEAIRLVGSGSAREK